MTTRMRLKDIKEMLDAASPEEAEVLLRSLEGDDRAGAVRLVASARRSLEVQRIEAERIESLYAFDRAHAGASQVVLGLDEVGRGPIAGPLAVGGVVLDLDQRIEGLNDSKLLSPERRESIAEEVRASCQALAIRYVQPAMIDEEGMAASLRRAFREAIDDVEAQGIHVDVILLDGNPLHLDERETNVIKGDRRSASIAAASIIAKVARDALMVELDAKHPGYGLAQNKGYGTQEHIEAVRTLGLSTVHRRSFCAAFAQESLF